MTRDQWKDQFTTDLWAMMAIGRQGTVMADSSGELVFGGYIVAFAAARDDDPNIKIIVMENVPVGVATAFDGASWLATTDDETLPIATDVASWLRPRWRG